MKRILCRPAAFSVVIAGFLAAAEIPAPAQSPPSASPQTGAVSPGLIPLYSSVFGLPPSAAQPRTNAPQITPPTGFGPVYGPGFGFPPPTAHQDNAYRYNNSQEYYREREQPRRIRRQRDYTESDADGAGIVTSNGTTIYTNGPVLLGGYYYGNYCRVNDGPNCYPSVFSVYSGFPQYIYNPAVIVLNQPYCPTYDTSYQPFYTPSYTVTYNQTNYYVTNEQTATDIESGGAHAQQAIKKAYPEGSYQAAFADIAHAWKDGNIALLRKHIRREDTKISVFLKDKYAYSIASSDFTQITKDAFDRLSTVSFQFTRLRKADNGDVTAYGKHLYRVDGAPQPDTGSATVENTVPFDQDQPSSSDNAGASSRSDEKTVYVSYTLHHKDDQWYIISTDSSPDPLVKE